MCLGSSPDVCYNGGDTRSYGKIDTMVYTFPRLNLSRLFEALDNVPLVFQERYADWDKYGGSSSCKDMNFEELERSGINEHYAKLLHYIFKQAKTEPSCKAWLIVYDENVKDFYNSIKLQGWRHLCRVQTWLCIGSIGEIIYCRPDRTERTFIKKHQSEARNQLREIVHHRVAKKMVDLATAEGTIDLLQHAEKVEDNRHPDLVERLKSAFGMMQTGLDMFSWESWKSRFLMVKTELAQLFTPASDEMKANVEKYTPMGWDYQEKDPEFGGMYNPLRRYSFIARRYDATHLYAQTFVKAMAVI